MYRETPQFNVHQHESNPESQAILDANTDVFSLGCAKVFNLLMRGNRMTIKEMDVDRARISDLKRDGYLLSFELKGRYKRWYMSPEQMEYNKQRLQNK